MTELAESRAGERVAAYKGGWMFVLYVVSVIAFAGIAVVARSFVGVVLVGGLALFMATQASTHCRRVELHADGVLNGHYFLRRSIATRADAVVSIDRDDEEGEWTVTFERGKFRLSPNRSAKRLVHALIRRKPTILLSGYTVPPL